MVTKVRHAFAWASTFVGVCLLAGYGFFKMGPSIELALLPPLKSVSATVIKINEDHTDVLLLATKARSCHVISISAVSIVNGERINGKIDMLNEDGSVLRLDQQRTSVGTKFVRLVRVTPASTHVEAYGEYRCHNFWTVNMKVFEVDTSETPAQVR